MSNQPTPQQETIDLQGITEELKDCSQQLLTLQTRLLVVQQRVEDMHRKYKPLPKAGLG